MVKVSKDQLDIIAPLFKGIEDSMVIACLQGHMGDAYVLSSNPKASVIVSGEYSFFGGDAKSEDALHIVEHFFDVNPNEKSVGIFADDNSEWEKTLMACPRNNPEAVPRFGIVQKDYDFDQNLLQDYADALPASFSLVPFNASIYHQAMACDWSKEFCETFASAEDYLTNGFGFAVIKDDELVSGASTMTIYDGGCEVQVATHDAYQQKGLAMACASALIMECARRGIRPCWDAANLISKTMALKLGYEYKGEYTTIHMHVPE
jgi:GNAT superfamily N-acetyltransferase